MKIAITGSIGTGKSTIARIMQMWGFPVLDSDKQVHHLLQDHQGVKDKISHTFPGVVVDNEINRHLLGKEVFGNDTKLRELEHILYPHLKKERDIFVKEQKEKGIEHVVFDVPLLFEKGIDKECDRIIVVTAPIHLQKERVLMRPRMTEEKFYAILSQQWPQSQKALRADVIIPSTWGEVYSKNLLEKYLKKEGIIK